MGKIEVFILLFVFILCNISVSQGQFRLNCYLSNPEKNGVPWWRMNMAVAADHCTHLTYGHANIDGEKMVPANATGDRVAYDKLREIRDKSIYGTKLLISVPTPDADFLGNKALSRIVKSRDSRVTFLRNVMEFLEMHKFDGIVLFWKYPGVTSMGGAATDRAGLAELVVELKIAFHGRGYILGLIGGANMDVVTQSTFDFASITKYVDFIDIGTHLRQLKSSPVPVHMAPLNVFAPALVTSPANRRSMTDSVMHWLTSGAQSSALNIAITTVGLHQKLTQEYDISQLDQLQPNRLMVVPDYTRQKSFSDICQIKMKEYYLGLWKAPLKFNGVDWISYDNEVSVQHKVAYMYSQGLGGVALASLNTDDVEGLCGNGKYPILRAVSQELQKVFGPRQLVTTPKPEPTQASKPTPPPTMPYTGAPLIPGKVLIINGTFPGLRPAEPAPAKARMSTLKMALLIVGILVIIALIVLLYVYSKTLKRLNHKRREVDRLKKTPLPPVNKPLMDSPKEMAPLPPKKPYMPPGAFSYQMNKPTTPTLPSPTEGIYEHLPGQDSGSEEEYEEPIPMNPLQRPLPRTPA